MLDNTKLIATVVRELLDTNDTELLAKLGIDREYIGQGQYTIYINGDAITNEMYRS